MNELQLEIRYLDGCSQAIPITVVRRDLRVDVLKEGLSSALQVPPDTLLLEGATEHDLLCQLKRIVIYSPVKPSAVLGYRLQELLGQEGCTVDQELARKTTGLSGNGRGPNEEGELEQETSSNNNHHPLGSKPTPWEAYELIQKAAGQARRVAGEDWWKACAGVLRDPSPDWRYGAALILEAGFTGDYLRLRNIGMRAEVARALLKAAWRETDIWVMRALVRAVEQALNGLEWLASVSFAELLVHAEPSVRLFAAISLVEAELMRGGEFVRGFLYLPCRLPPHLGSFVGRLVCGTRSVHDPVVRACEGALELLLEYCGSSWDDVNCSWTAMHSPWRDSRDPCRWCPTGMCRRYDASDSPLIPTTEEDLSKLGGVRGWLEQAVPGQRFLHLIVPVELLEQILTEAQDELELPQQVGETVVEYLGYVRKIIERERKFRPIGLEIISGLLRRENEMDIGQTGKYGEERR